MVKFVEIYPGAAPLPLYDLPEFATGTGIMGMPLAYDPQRCFAILD